MDEKRVTTDEDRVLLANSHLRRRRDSTHFNCWVELRRRCRCELTITLHIHAVML